MMGRLEKEETTRLERIYKIHSIKDKEKCYEQLLEILETECKNTKYPGLLDITFVERCSPDYDKTSGLIGICKCVSYLLEQFRMTFSEYYRSIIRDFSPIKNNRDRYCLTILFYILKSGKMLFSEYMEAIKKVLDYKEKK